MFPAAYAIVHATLHRLGKDPRTLRLQFPLIRLRFQLVFSKLIHLYEAIPIHVCLNMFGLAVMAEPFKCTVL